MKRILIAGVLVLVVGLGGVSLWARSMLTSDAVRSALAAQVSQALGQPVSIGALDATIFPRVSVTLGTVAIGQPGQVSIESLQVGTDFRALLSRRIEHASLRLTGARLTLPLPPLALATASQPSPATEPPVELVSIDEIVLSDVEVISGGRTLRGDIEVVPEGKGLLIRKMQFGADKTTVDIGGRVTDPAGPVGELTVKAGALDLNQLLAFVSDFTAGATGGTAPASSSSGAPAIATEMRMLVSLDAESASMGGLTLTAVKGTAKIAGGQVTLDPVSFGIFGGQYQGALTLSPGAEGLRFSGRSKLTNVDVATATKFGGSSEAISGRLTGQVEFSGRGSDPAAILRTAVAKGRVDIVDGTVKHLGLVESVVLATSMRAGSAGQALDAAKSGRDEPFSKLGATLQVANGTLTTNDLQFDSKDLVLTAQGAVNAVSSTVDLKGRVQLSDALSQQAGQDLARYTQEQGRVTLPVTVAGSIDAPRVRVDAGDMAKRALRNAAAEQAERAKAEAGKAITRKLGGLFGKS